MVKIELNDLPGYAIRKETPIRADEDGNILPDIMCYPIPDLDMVCEDTIKIINNQFQMVEPKLALKMLHFLYGPNELSNRYRMGIESPRLYFKESFRNRWLRCSQYGKPITIFTSDIKGLNVDISNQLVFKQSNVVDLQHPYCEKIVEIFKGFEITDWPWMTLEIYISNLRLGDNILGQIQLYEIDLDIKYYIEVDDITPFTVYQLTQ